MGCRRALLSALRRASLETFLALILAGVVLGTTGCGSKEEAAEESPAAALEPPAPASTEALSAARQSLKSGNVQDAAARLAQLQTHGARFNAQQAKDYRQLLSEAYDRAMEAAQRGDPQAQATIQLLRAAAPR